MFDHRDAMLKIVWHRLPDGRSVHKIAERLWNEPSGYFRFVESGVPATNNLCEQSIRCVAIDRTITQGTRSNWGNRGQKRLWNVLSTIAQTGRNVLSFFCKSVSSLFGKRNFPSLLTK